MKDIATPFTQATGVKIEYQVQTTSGSTMSKLVSTKGNPGFDIWVSAGSFGYQAGAAGLLTPLDTSAIPNLQFVRPEVLNRMKVNGSLYGVPIDEWVFGIASLPSKASNPITTFRGILAPTNPASLKGQNVWWPQMFWNSGDLLVQTSLLLGGNESNVSRGWNALGATAPYIAGAYSSDSEINSNLLQGNIWQAMVPSYTAWIISHQGQNLNFVVPTDSQPIIALDSMSVTKGAHNLAVAEQFINFALTANVQQNWVNDQGRIPMNKNAISLMDSNLVTFYGGAQSVQSLYNGYLLDFSITTTAGSSWNTQFSQQIVPKFGTGQ